MVRIGVSACLLGERVRYDGAHKRDAWLADELARQAELVPLCPEIEIGLGVPRPPLHLERRPAAPGEGAPDVRMVVTATGEDLTDRMRAWAEATAERLARADLDGYVLKSRSPSCGLHVEDVRGAPVRGLFAAALVERLPDLPVVEESNLRDTAARERFLRAVRDHARRRESAVERGRTVRHEPSAGGEAPRL